MNAGQEFVSEHPVISTLIAVAVAVRILWRRINGASKLIADVNASTVAEQLWNGVDRRGPNRARNVYRPPFGQTSHSSFTVLEDLKTGTKD